jgi:protocatechuate 3,4-dioxygenase beta subunit
MTPDPQQSKLLFGNRHRAVADGVEAVAVKVRLRDSRGRPVAGREVELTADRGGVYIEQPELTDSDGRAIGYVRATLAGPVNITGFVLPVESSSEPL